MFKLFKKKTKKEEVLILGDHFNDDLPEFKYHQSVLDNKIIIESEIVCECCNMKSKYKYDNLIYSKSNVEDLCPWCIANGEAAKKYEGDFVDLTCSEKVTSKEAQEELSKRTPEYLAWQQPIWLAHCNDYCKYIGNVGWNEIKHLEDELKDDIQNICEEFEMDLEEFKETLFKEGTLQGYLFQCIHCGQYRLCVDLS